MRTADVQNGILYRFAFSKILVIVLLALLCAGLFISVSNDLFAFVKPSRPYTVEITDAHSASELSALLQRRGIIENSLGFLIYVELKGHGETLQDFRGSVELNSDMSYGEILTEFLNYE